MASWFQNIATCSQTSLSENDMCSTGNACRSELTPAQVTGGLTCVGNIREFLDVSAEVYGLIVLMFRLRARRGSGRRGSDVRLETSQLRFTCFVKLARPVPQCFIRAV